MSKKLPTRHVLELAFQFLLEHPYRPPGLRLFETGDVVAEASFEGEVNARFRTSGFSFLADGEWTEYPWDSIVQSLPPDSGLMSETRLRIKLKDGRSVSFQMDHFGGYYGLFDNMAGWSAVPGLWRRVIERCTCQ